MQPPMMVNYIIYTQQEFQIPHLTIMSWWYDKYTMAPGINDLHISQTATASVNKLGDASWHLEIPAETRSGYRLAQLDDHGALQRRHLPWHPPLKFSLQARLSSHDIPGTWGFGFWNDPFSFLFANKQVVPRLPVLPEAAWFFHASPQNHLSFRDDLPANGFLAATFSSKKVSTALLALASPALVLAMIPETAEIVRKAFRRLIRQDTYQVHHNVTEWHEYSMEWDTSHVSFYLDGTEILQTDVTPSGPLSLVIWVDNQYAALPPNEKVRYGTLPNLESAWMEIKELSIREK